MSSDFPILFKKEDLEMHQYANYQLERQLCLMRKNNSFRGNMFQPISRKILQDKQVLTRITT